MNGAMDMLGRAAMNRAKRGIYVGKQVRFGNNVSFSKRRTRRTFQPNVQTKTFYSKILDREIQLRVTAKAIRCIQKAGNFDTFILEKEHLTQDSDIAQKLRKEMLCKLPPAPKDEKVWTKFPYY
mmetsp:Transcript_11031/g.13796  ORF Transcript_11031/g.13796 Transcript_11031/m.13796 type:complete len:124 (+) Transcript_11031:302-673(+)